MPWNADGAWPSDIADLAGAAGTSASAGVATGTGTANAATTSSGGTAAAAGTAAGTGAALAPTVTAAGTRLYLSNAVPGFTPTTKRGAWDSSATTLARYLSPQVAGLPATSAVAETDAGSTFDVLLGRWISAPIATAGTLSGTLEMVLGALESNALANQVLHVHAYVTTGDTDTPRGTLLTDSLGATEFPTTAAGMSFPPASLTGVACSLGDRVVVEIGYQAQDGSATSRTGTIRYGGTGADLAAGGTSTATPGWVQFTDPANVLTPPIRGIGTVVAVAAAGGSTLTGITIGQVGDLLSVGTIVNSGSITVTGVSGTKSGSWTKVRAAILGPGSAENTDLWIGTATAVGSETLTFTFSSAIGTTATRFTCQMARSRYGASTVWALDGTQSAGSTGTSSTAVTFPSLTASSDHEYYFGYASVAETGAAGTTAEVVYGLDVQTNIFVYSVTANGATAPAAVMAPAGTYTRTGAVITATNPAVAAAAGRAAGTGAALAPTVTVSASPAAGLAAGTGAAAAPTVRTAVAAAAGVAAGTGAALAAAANTPTTIPVAAGSAAGTGAALAPSIATSSAFPTGTAAGSGAAGDPSIVVGTVAAPGTAAGTGAALAPSIAVSFSAGAAAGSGASPAPGISTAQPAPAGAATGTGAALAARPNVGARAGVAAGTGAALAPEFHKAGVPMLVGVVDTARIAVEIAWGADLTADASTWSWTDISSDVRYADGISTRHGRGDEAATTQPASLALTLDNRGGDYSQGGQSRNWPNVRRNTPVRVSVDPGDNFHVSYLGFAVGFEPGWDPTGTDATVKLTAAGTLRRLAQGTAPVTSAMRRLLLSKPNLIAYWPCEDAKGSRTIASAVPGHPVMTISGDAEQPYPKFQESTNFLTSASIPEVALTSWHGKVPPYYERQASPAWQVRWLMKAPELMSGTSATMMSIYTSGTVARWDIVYANASDGWAEVHGYSSSGTSLVSQTGIAININNTLRRWSFSASQSGADISYRLEAIGIGYTSAGGVNGAVTSASMGRITSVVVAPQQDIDDTVIGHVSVEDVIGSLESDAREMNAFDGELADARIERLCEENGVPITVIGASGVAMGPQTQSTLVALLRECEEADQGILYDGIDAGLTYVCGSERSNVEPALTLDMAGGQLAKEFAPVDDDQRNVNKVKASRKSGSSATYEDVTGPLGSAAIGTYDDSVTVNINSDGDIGDYASWAVHQGTTPGYRYPSLQLQLSHDPDLVTDWLTVEPSSRIDVIGVDTVRTQQPSGALRSLVEGYSQRIDQYQWGISLNLSSYEPWIVGEAAQDSGDVGEYVQRLDTDGSALAAAASSGATSLSVATRAPIIVADTFTRTGTGGWGTADTGQSWTTFTAAAAWSTTGSAGAIALPAAGVFARSAVTSPACRNAEVAFTATLSVPDVTGGSIAPMSPTLGNALGYYFAFFTVDSSENLLVRLYYADLVAVTLQQLSAGAVPAFAYSSGSAMRVRMRIEEGTLYARAWLAAGAEPAGWDVQAATGLAPAPVYGGVRAELAAGCTNTGVTVAYDNFEYRGTSAIGLGPDNPLWTTDSDDLPLDIEVGGIRVPVSAISGTSSPQTFTVSGVTKALSTDSTVALWRPAVPSI